MLSSLASLGIDAYCFGGSSDHVQYFESLTHLDRIPTLDSLDPCEQPGQLPFIEYEVAQRTCVLCLAYPANRHLHEDPSRQDLPGFYN
jgi:hypothetical protein